MSMHPQPIPAIPEETVRLAHAVLLRATGGCRCEMNLERCPRIKISRICFLAVGNQPRLHGDWPWSPSCNMGRDSQTGKPPMPCAPALIGNMC